MTIIEALQRHSACFSRTGTEHPVWGRWTANHVSKMTNRPKLWRGHLAGGGSGQSTRRINITNLEKNADDGRLLVDTTRYKCLFVLIICVDQKGVSLPG